MSLQYDTTYGRQAREAFGRQYSLPLVGGSARDSVLTLSIDLDGLAFLVGELEAHAPKDGFTHELRAAYDRAAQLREIEAADARAADAQAEAERVRWRNA